jgi:hypothetical protein
VVGLDETGKQFDDGRFAGAVFAEQGMRRALLDGEAHVIDSERCAKRFAQRADCDGAIC